MIASADTIGGMTRPAAPQVTVVIATYNRSGPLRHAISSVLAQTYRDFELLVVGDACTDDSEAVVRGFADPRVHWHNLPDNCGNQFGPNNHGLAQARGQYIAYLGHDDLWHSDHLTTLMGAIEAREADLVFSLTLDVGPPDNPTRQVLGICPDGAYEWPLWGPPSSWLHRRDIEKRIGGWRDYQSIVLPTDVDFFMRIYEQRMRIVPVAEVTVLKLTSTSRINSYLDRTGDEQAFWWDRLQHDPELRYRETLAALAAVARRHVDATLRFAQPSRSTPGSIVDSYRARRGLGRLPRRAGLSVTPLSLDRPALRLVNSQGDIAPDNDRIVLHGRGELPVDGLFIGLNWHGLETDPEGRRWRWMDRNAQIVVTRPSGRRRRLAIDLAPGPGFGGRPANLLLHDGEDTTVACAQIDKAGPIALEVPLPAAAGAILVLDADGGGNVIPGDPRVLNFRVFGFRWADA
jgi:hypothetical protein